jgi:hypothetical protein
MKAANLANDYLPDPPTPIRRALPTPSSRIRTIRATCWIAYENNTRFITFLLSLYSASFSSKHYFSWFNDSIST